MIKILEKSESRFNRCTSYAYIVSIASCRLQASDHHEYSYNQRVLSRRVRSTGAIDVILNDSNILTFNILQLLPRPVVYPSCTKCQSRLEYLSESTKHRPLANLYQPLHNHVSRRFHPRQPQHHHPPRLHRQHPPRPHPLQCGPHLVLRRQTPTSPLQTPLRPPRHGVQPPTDIHDARSTEICYLPHLGFCGADIAVLVHG